MKSYISEECPQINKLSLIWFVSWPLCWSVFKIQSVLISQLLKLGLVFLCARDTFLPCSFLYLALIQLCYELILVIVIGEIRMYPEDGTVFFLRREICMTFWIKLLHCWEFSQQLVFTTVCLMLYLCYFLLTLQVRNFACFNFHYFCSWICSMERIEDSGLCKHIALKVQHAFNIITWFQAIH